ncbi:MAG: S-layer family protein [Cyanobacteria bacterium P01_G01_bin.54]
MPKHFTLDFRLVLAIFLGISGSSQIAQAQVTSDGTLSTGVSNTGSDYTITGGTTSGTNLFHSFDQFSVPTGGSATFDNATTIENIFSRVTGGNISSIDGFIATQGTANLFLVNPAGITFGENTTLSIGGSFFGSTAETVLFPNSFEFNATSPTTPALLSIHSPIGLDMGNNPGAIEVQGPGHHFTSPLFTFDTFGSTAPERLAVNTGETLALIGGDITFTGGQALAPSGQIVIAGIATGMVNFAEGTSPGYTFGYEGVSGFKDISLAQQTALDASGNGQGAIEIVGNTISMTDGSIAVIDNVGSQSNQSITVQATDSLLIDGLGPGNISSGLISDGFGDGNAATIQIDAENLILTNSGQIATADKGGAGLSGQITINVNNSIQIIGSDSFFDPATVPGILNLTQGFSDLQGIDITARELTMTDGAWIVSFSVSGTQGNIGVINIQVTDSIEITGTTDSSGPFSLGPFNATTIGSRTFGAGEANTVAIDTTQLFVRDGARISTTTADAGNAGNVMINASELIQVSGTVLGLVNPTSIDSGGTIIDSDFATLVGLPPFPSGNSGDVTLNTPRLEVLDGARVTVRNNGTGNAGTLAVNADNILLRDRAGLTASTVSGEGGNIDLNANQSILLRQGSLISAEAGGTGNGGNITIIAPFIVAVPGENSDIIANAVFGSGGNITITATGILGLEFRDQLTEFSDITASSQFGVSGTVTITNPNTTLTGLEIELQGDVLDPDQAVTQGCDAVGNSRFVATGRGGVPENPLNPRPGNSTWSDVRDLAAFRQTSPTTTRQAPETEPPVIIEATGVRRNEEGELELYAETYAPYRTAVAAHCAPQALTQSNT